jgi:hypothetical protein
MALRPTVDHVVFAWDDLDELSERFAAVELSPEYGGPHDNGATHMSVLGFEDGSYVELIAPTGDGRPPLWGSLMRGQGGPSAWCLDVADVERAVKQAVDADVAVAGPWAESRERPDGVRVEWDKALLGVEQNSADQESWLLPFVISDRTPRRYRVRPSDSAVAAPVEGVETVVLAAAELDRTVERLTRLFRLPTPVTDTVDALDARVASFPGTAVALATPVDDEGWVADRLSAFGPGPCTYLLRTSDVDDATSHHPTTGVDEWPTGRVAWLDADPFRTTLGLVEPRSR